MIAVPTGRVYDDVFLQEGPLWHFDKPRRLEVIREQLEACGLWDELLPLPVTEADTQLISTVHEAAYIEDVRTASEMGGDEFDLDTVVTGGTYQAAASAVGGCAAAWSTRMSNTWRRARRCPGAKSACERLTVRARWWTCYRCRESSLSGLKTGDWKCRLKTWRLFRHTSKRPSDTSLFVFNVLHLTSDVLCDIIAFDDLW